MWKPEHSRAAARQGLRYPSDLTDARRLVAEFIRCKVTVRDDQSRHARVTPVKPSLHGWDLAGIEAMAVRMLIALMVERRA